MICMGSPALPPPRTLIWVKVNPSIWSPTRYGQGSSIPRAAAPTCPVAVGSIPWIEARSKKASVSGSPGIGEEADVHSKLLVSWAWPATETERSPNPINCVAPPAKFPQFT